MTSVAQHPATLAGFAPRAASSVAQSDAAVRHRAFAALWLCAGVASLVMMPPVYGLVAYHGAITPLFRLQVLEHLAANCLANLMVILGALRARGRLDEKLTTLFSLTLLAHGSLAFATLVTRHFYSIPMMLVGGMASASLGAAGIYLRTYRVRLRVGLLGPWHPIVENPDIDCVRMDSAACDIDSIDVLLVTFASGHSVVGEPILLRALLRGTRVRHVADFIEESRGACALEHFEIDQIPVAALGRYRPLKRALDIILVVASLPVALPILAAGALGVLLTMGRPILYIQPRVGRGGEAFDMIKLRTMRVATALDIGTATVANDPRITPFGAFLRRFRIDELPQLFNVLRGQMSVIGPRPEWTALADRYAAQEPKYVLRHLVRPGITGWAQVRAEPAADLEETRVKLSYDLFYLKFASFALDLQILWRTAWTLVAGGGVR
jgi:lipopolysaccharide/colanic/teichoic acid biosynthesis glycosyltransferase